MIIKQVSGKRKGVAYTNVPCEVYETFDELVLTVGEFDVLKKYNQQHETDVRNSQAASTSGINSTNAKLASLGKQLTSGAITFEQFKERMQALITPVQTA